MFGRESTETMEVTAFDPPKRYEIGALACGVEFRSEFLFTPVAEGTRVDVTTGGTAKSFFAKLMSPLSGMMAGAMKKCVEGDLADIKAHVEGLRVGA